MEHDRVAVGHRYDKCASCISRSEDCHLRIFLVRPCLHLRHVGEHGLQHAVAGRPLVAAVQAAAVAEDADAALSCRR